MAYEFHYERRIHFQETDAGGLIHFSNYFRYMEEVETEFLFAVYREAGREPLESVFAAPRVAVSAEFLKPTRFGDMLDCHLWISHKGRTSIGYQVDFKRDSELVARGKLTFVCVEEGDDGEYRSCRIPEALDELVEVAPYAAESNG